jgi:HSP20 family protein
MDRLRGEMEELFADLCQVPRLAGGRAFRPRLDVYRTGDPPEITVIAELAGIDPKDVELAFADGTLVLSGARRRDAKPGAHYQHMEIDHGAFERRVEIQDPIDIDGIEAVYDRGILSVTLPIAAREPRRVKVEITPGRSA